ENAMPPWTVKELRVTRLGEQGPLEEIVDQGLPILLDAAGNVWLVEMRGLTVGSRFSVWSNGRIVKQIEIPCADTIYSVVSDRPGSVYAWTTFGLHHLVATKPEDAGSFELRETFALPGLVAWGNHCAYSEKLGLVFTMSGYQLCCVRLPGEDSTPK